MSLPTCPLCGSTSWDTYAKQHAKHTGGLTIVCEAVPAGPSRATYCGWSIDLTREQMIEAAFLVTKQGAPGCSPDCHTWDGHHRPGCPNERAAEAAKPCTCDKPHEAGHAYALCSGCSKKICAGCASWFDNDMKCTGECHECADLFAAVSA